MPSHSTAKEDGPLLIRVGRFTDGAAYALHPLSETRIQTVFPEAQGLPKVFFGYANREEFEARHRPLWELTARLLIGLSMEQVGRLGGVRIYDPGADEVIWEWQPAKVTTC